MAQLKDLLVAGKARFVGTTSFTDQMISLGGIRFLEGALEKKTVVYQVLGIDSSGVAVYADLTGLTIGTANKLSVSGGGTMQPVYFASGQPVTLPAFKNLTAIGPLGWVSTANDIMAVTSNTLAYWNGAYSGTASNITVLGKIQTGTWQATPIDAARGGTGQTSLVNSANVLLNALTTGSSTPADNDYYISQYVNGGTTTTTYHRRPMSKLWDYISGKIDTAHKYVLKAGDTMTGSLVINGNDKDYGLIIRRTSADNESLKIFNESSYTKFVSTNETTSGQIYFTLSNLDESNDGAGANSSDVIFKGTSSGSEVVATKFTGALNGNATTATTASKLGVNAGSTSLPVYFTNGIPNAVTNIEISTTNTNSKYVKTTNSNGSVGLYSATNRGMYDFTKSAWIVYNTTAGDHTYIPLWKSKGNSKLPVYFNSSGEPVACGTTLDVSISGTAAKATLASTLAVNAGADGKPIYFAGGIPVAFANNIGGAAKPVYVNSGTITACSSTVGSTTKPVYMNAGTITVSNATVGSASRPMYLNAGTMTAVTAVGTAYGGTGNTAYNANRVVYTESATKMSSTNHFASSVKMAINSTAEPATTFHVEGSANVDGEFSLDSKAKFVYNNTDKCVDIIFV